MMSETLQSETKAYYLAFSEALGKENAQILSKRLLQSTRSRTRVCLHTIQAQAMLRQENFRSSMIQADVSHGGVLVVENIDLDWIATLGVVFNISPAFFAEHAENPRGCSPWSAVFGKWSADHRKPISRRMEQRQSDYNASAVLRESWHVDGVVEFETLAKQQQQHQLAPHPLFSFGEANLLPRVIACDSQSGWQATTRISYSLLTSQLYLMLVDAPFITSSDNTHSSPTNPRPHLRIPVGLNRGGLNLPFLLDEAVPSIFSCLHRFFSHPWHFHVLFAKDPNADIHLSPVTILHLVASSTWEANLRILERRIKQISFEDIRRPSIRTVDALHQQRRDLTSMLEQVTKTLKWMPPRVRSELETVKDRLPAAKYIGYPDLVQSEILGSAVQLEKFLMNTFSLLLSTISVLEAESTREQTIRGQTLTKLAFVYVPLSFVTSIFGMNVKEINGSPLSIWTTIITFIVIGCCTGIIFTVYKIWQVARKT